MCMYYVYVDWTTDSDPYYVGQGNQRRTGKKHRNSLHSNITLKHGFESNIVLETDKSEDA